MQCNKQASKIHRRVPMYGLLAEIRSIIRLNIKPQRLRREGSLPLLELSTKHAVLAMLAKFAVLAVLELAAMVLELSMRHVRTMRVWVVRAMGKILWVVRAMGKIVSSISSCCCSRTPGNQSS